MNTMNRKTFSSVAALALITAAGVAPGCAQEMQVRAHIPFTFAVSSSTLPAGDYSLEQVSQNAWVIRNDNGSSTVTAGARPNGNNQEVESAGLIFTRCGQHYFLSEVRSLGRSSAIPASKGERALEREMAGNGSKAETVHLAVPCDTCKHGS